ncbi:MAG: MarR family transcriptional regulator [Anaerolineae bacterium]|nr:MarR family transcriptional regulator [Anaerolineae bacterium]
MEQDRYNLDDWQLLAQVSQLFRSISDSFTEQVDIPRGQAGLLCVVAKQDGLAQTEIAEQLSVRGATVTNMLQRLEEAGLVIRRRDVEDNRLVRVYITEAGSQKEDAINERFGNLQQLIFKDINADERVMLKRLLQQIIFNLTEES